MSSTDLVRSSRDGDQFHYYWAARQCLKMLLPGSGLAAVSIEGSSPEDPMAADGQKPRDDPTGEYVVDIAEYYGDAAPDKASKIVYRQLKHSTEHPDQPWTVSGLKNTLEGFGRRFSTLTDVSPGLRERVTFEFVSNRPVDDIVLRALSDIGQEASPANPKTAGYIRTYLGLPDDLARQFCQQFKVDTRAPGLLQLAHLYQQDVGALLPGAPNDGPLRLKEDIEAATTDNTFPPPRSLVRDGAIPTVLISDSARAFVGRAARRRVRRMVVAQSRHYLDEAGRAVLKPDIVWRIGGKVAAVIDAKYKAEKPSGFPNADLYQLLAYCTVLGLRVGHLVYAAGNEQPVRYVVRQAGTEIICHALDLSEPPARLLMGVDHLASVVAASTLQRNHARTDRQ